MRLVTAPRVDRPVRAPVRVRARPERTGAARRRGALRRLALGLLFAGPVLAGCSEPPSPRHVVLICIDTLRADRLGLYGGPADNSPRLDALAREGVWFARATAPSNWTVPSVASLFTSRYPHQHGASLDGAIRNLGPESRLGELDGALRPIGRRFAEAGFATAMIAANPFLHGRFHDGFELARTERVDATTLVDRALDWLAAPEPRPRFLYLHFMDVHEPNLAPREYHRAGEPAIDPADGEWRDPWRRAEDLDSPEFLAARERRLRAYDAAIRYVDAEVGRLLDRLAELGLRQETLVAVTADHGEELWDHADVERRWGDDPRGIWGVGHGHSFFEEQLHVPLILAGAGVPAAGRSECTASLVDVAPTLARRFALPADRDQRGLDLLERTASDAPGCRTRPVFASSSAYGPDGLAVIAGRFKLHRRGDRAPMTFDLGDDPDERRDLGAGPAWADRLVRLAEAYERAAGEATAPVEWNDPERLEELRALGYL